jgi:hypothetical protein
MVRYIRTGPQALVVASSSGGTLGIPNHGVSILASTAAGDWAMSPPVAGIMKTLIVQPATSGTTRVVKLSTTSSADSITIIGNTGDSVATEINFNSTGLMTVTMVGLSTAQWKILHASSGVGAALTTGIAYQTS